MAAVLTKTRTPGVYKRGGRYVVTYRDTDGTQRKESARTYDLARQLKLDREGQVAAGEQTAGGRVRLAEYAREWIDRYQGQGRRGFREITRDQYRGDLDRYVLPYLDGRLKRTVAQVTPRDVANFIGWLCDERAQGERAATEKDQELAKPVVLADATVRRILAPLRSCLATAMHEGLIRSNPTAGASLPARDATRAAEAGYDEEPDRRALSRRELRDLLAVAPERYRPLFWLLASTGLRISEALALRWCDVSLDGSRPVVRVRRAYVKGRLGPPKSRHGRRSVPLEHGLVRELRKARVRGEWPGDDDLVFCSPDGRPLHDRNLSARALKPAAQEAGCPWAGWHTLRHTCASLLFARGANAVQVQRWLGHHSPGFTLSTYVHLLDDDLGAPLDLGAETAQSGNKVATRHPETAGIG
jgi:integrase